jgi:hypothetical protein
MGCLALREEMAHGWMVNLSESLVAMLVWAVVVCVVVGGVVVGGQAAKRSLGGAVHQYANRVGRAMRDGDAE